MSNPPFYHYVIVRDDLPRGTALAQTIHAAGETATPLPISGTHAVCLAAKNEEDLLRVAHRLERRNIPHKLICEPDAPYHNQAMAIGVYPVQDRKPIKRALSRLQLVTERKKDDNHDC